MSLLDQFVLEGVAGDFHVAAQAGLFLDSSEIGADCFLAQHQFAGDLFDRPAQGDQPEDLELAIGKLLVQCPRIPAFQAGGELLRDRRADVRAAVEDFSDRQENLVRSELFVDVTGGAGPERL